MKIERIALGKIRPFIEQYIILNMKRIFSFLLTIGLVFWISEAFGDNVTMPTGSKVRYAIELKQLTKQEAQDAVANGYVDLWVWAYFNQKFFDQGYITLRDNKIYDFNIRFVSNTQGYQIVYKDGTNDLRPDNKSANPGWVASFARKAQQEAIVYTREESSQVGTMQMLDCNGSGSGGSLDGPLNVFTGPDYMVKIETFEGETWYGRALYKIRFEYNRAESFYVEHRFNNKPANNCGYATANFNIRIGTSGNIFAPYPTGCSGNADWSQTHTDNPAGTACEKIAGAFGVIRGGVEVIADPEMILSAEATCGGTDATGKLSVNDWAGKSWTDYGPVKYYVNKTGGTVRKQIAAGDITVTPAIPTSGSASEIAYTLTSAGYTLTDGSYADSLIWVIEDTFLA